MVTPANGTPKSGIKGVTWHSKAQKWRARRVDADLGLFDTVEEAREALERLPKIVKTKSSVGDTFTRLTVLEFLGRDQKSDYYLCQCSCGTVLRVSGTSLRTGHTKSCGCLARDTLTTQIKIGTTFERLTVLERLGGGDSAGARYRCKCSCDTEVIVRGVDLRNGHTKSCGCLMRETQAATLEKARGEMFVAGTNLSEIGSDKLRINNSSGVKGVSYHETTKRWRARIMFQGREHFLGAYDSFQDAVVARKNAEAELHGDFIAWYKETYPDRKVPGLED